jgi:ABC-type transport system involved in cytochrome bd biosynthesis fused ATPase/permease subunit
MKSQTLQNIPRKNEPCFKIQNCECLLKIHDGIFVCDTQCCYRSNQKRGNAKQSVHESVKTRRIVIKDFCLKRAYCTCLVGPEGSGKTDFIMCLLNEMTMIQGEVQWYPFDQKKMRYATSRLGPTYPVAYAGQMCWLPLGTVREVILFGRPYNKTLYDTIIRICELHNVRSWIYLPLSSVSFFFE